ncbi:hypothetical protein QE152_g33202 [Popillia japonica]|uniref:Uncharacterized protein n=1 Tax=Popillia japonica TaxID=7064 RepID=A0AAW1IY48_POPJA
MGYCENYYHLLLNNKTISRCGLVYGLLRELLPSPFSLLAHGIPVRLASLVGELLAAPSRKLQPVMVFPRGKRDSEKTRQLKNCPNKQQNGHHFQHLL